MPDDVKPIKPDAARAQAAEFLGVYAGVEFDLGGTTWTLPHPSFMPPDMRARYLEHLRFITDDLDTEQAVDPITKRKTTTRKWPLQFGGNLLDEDMLLCIALMGDDAKADRDTYLTDGKLPEMVQRFIDADGRPGQVQLHWRIMNLQLEERISRDPK